MWFCACWFVCLVFSFFFFFQAEDGIRDWSVTGVQTCALPILVALLDLAEVMDKPVRQLSLGERMKCELAAALLHRPRSEERRVGKDSTYPSFTHNHHKNYSAHRSHRFTIVCAVTRKISHTTDL